MIFRLLTKPAKNIWFSAHMLNPDLVLCSEVGSDTYMVFGSEVGSWSGFLFRDWILILFSAQRSYPDQVFCSEVRWVSGFLLRGQIRFLFSTVYEYNGIGMYYQHRITLVLAILYSFISTALCRWWNYQLYILANSVTGGVIHSLPPRAHSLN